MLRIPAWMLLTLACGFTGLGVLVLNERLSTATAQTVVEALETRELRIVDATGTVRAVLGLTQDENGEQPSLRLLAADGKTIVAAMDVAESGHPRVAIYEEGVSRAEMSFTNIFLGPMFQLSDTKGIDRVRLRFSTSDVVPSAQGVLSWNTRVSSSTTRRRRAATGGRMT